jgi:hypothetical protein
MLRLTQARCLRYLAMRLRLKGRIGVSPVLLPGDHNV